MPNDASTNREFAEYLANAFKEVDWPIPPYLRLGFLSPLAKAIKDAPQNAKLAIMGEKLAGAYTADYLAASRPSETAHGHLTGETPWAYGRSC